jgi:hypothetical protein
VGGVSINDTGTLASSPTAPTARSRCSGSTAGFVEAAPGAVQTLRDRDLTRPYPNMGHPHFVRLRRR